MQRQRTHRFPRHSLLLLLLFSFAVFSSCGEKYDMPPAGYDYSLCGGVLLGYPIPRKGEQFVLHASDVPSAVYADEAGGQMTYPHCQIETLCLSDGTALYYAALPQNMPYDGEKRVFFAYADEHRRILEGSVGGRAVMLEGGALFLVSENGISPVTDDCIGVASLDDGALLYAASDGLYAYRDGKITLCMTTDASVADVWYVRGTPDHRWICITEDGTLYTGREGEQAQPCALQSPPGDGTKMLLLRGTRYALCGTDEDSGFYDLLTRETTPLDMGGLVRFPDRDIAVRTVPLSPDGVFAYFYDINYIYRIDPARGTVDTVENEALIYENRCVISSMTPLTDERLLLSQSGSEMTEYNPLILTAAFTEDIPQDREDDFRP